MWRGVPGIWPRGSCQIEPAIHLLFLITMKRETIPIADIYVPTKRRATLEQKRVRMDRDRTSTVAGAAASKLIFATFVQATDIISVEVLLSDLHPSAKCPEGGISSTAKRIASAAVAKRR